MTWRATSRNDWIIHDGFLVGAGVVRGKGGGRIRGKVVFRGADKGGRQAQALPSAALTFDGGFVLAAGLASVPGGQAIADDKSLAGEGPQHGGAGAVLDAEQGVETFAVEGGDGAAIVGLRGEFEQRAPDGEHDGPVLPAVTGNDEPFTVIHGAVIPAKPLHGEYLRGEFRPPGGRPHLCWYQMVLNIARGQSMETGSNYRLS